MADTIINVNSGFYNAINDDRTYYAEDMNRPYRRLVSNGVFATNRGTPSTDFQVLPGGGMTVTVAPGEGIFANKWLENPSTISFTVPAVSGLRNRIDSVIIQVDERNAGRVGSIVYRTGTAAASPAAPAINEVANVTEYRLANVLVSPLSTNSGVKGTDITDFRGSSECPWVVALIQQPDTDALWGQYQVSFQELLESMEETNSQALSDAQGAWGAFFSQVQSDIGAAMNILVLRSSTEISTETTVVPIGIPSYAPGTDTLQVFINGFMAQEGVFYEVDGTNINLVNPIGTGDDADRVDIIVLKATTQVNIAQVESLVNALEARFDNEIADTGWITADLTFTNCESVNSAGDRMSYRRIGSVGYLRGCITNLSATTGALVGLPYALWPASRQYFSSPVLRNDNEIVATAALRIEPDGFVHLVALSAPVQATDWIPLCTSWSLVPGR